MIDASVFIHATEPYLTRFVESLKEDGAGCWRFTRGAIRGRDGRYGRFSIYGRSMGAHIIAYEWAYGPFFHWLDIDHQCRNTRCCNPAHLRSVTRLENNIAAKAIKGDQSRHNNPLRQYSRDQKLTWSAIADQLGVTRDVVRSLLRCTHRPEGDLLSRLASILVMSDEDVVAVFSANQQKRPRGAEFCTRGHSMSDPANICVNNGNHDCRACKVLMARRRYDAKCRALAAPKTTE